MIIYIHGFGSSGFSSKAAVFKKYFGKALLAPSLSYVPVLAMDTLTQLVEAFLEKNKQLAVAGSSLGGFYAVYLAEKYQLKAAVINPAMYPYELLNKMGLCRNYYDDSSFEMKPEHMTQLKKFYVPEITTPENIMALLQKGDELLNYQDAVDRLVGGHLIVEEGGDHSFVDIGRYLAQIDSFLFPR